MYVDSHVHVVGDAARYPMIPNRSYTPPVATVEQLKALAESSRVTRFVVVQPSFYGTDNTLVLDALAALGPRGAGVAVLDPMTTGEHAAVRLAASGIRGLRINLYSTHGAQRYSLSERFTALAGLARRMNGHIQVIADLPVLLEAMELLALSDVPVVMDHYGLPGGERPEGEMGRRLLTLMRLTHVWMKLSAPYRNSADRLSITPDRTWLAALLQVAPQRCVWGSDWPHTPALEDQPGMAGPAGYRPLDYPAVVAAFRDAVGDAPTADRVMGENAVRLYGF